MFSVWQFWTQSMECSKVKPKPKVNHNVASLNISMLYNLNKIIKISDLGFSWIADSKNQATLLFKTIYNKLNGGILNSSDIGFGKCSIKPLEFFEDQIQIDNFMSTVSMCCWKWNCVSGFSHWTWGRRNYK